MQTKASILLDVTAPNIRCVLKLAKFGNMMKEMANKDSSWDTCTKIMVANLQ